MNKGRNKKIRARYREIDRSIELTPASDKTLRRFYALGDTMEKVEHPFTKLGRIYKFAAEVIDEAIGDLHVCQAGCAHCCRIAVEITPLEALYIEYGTGHKKIEPLRKGINTDAYCPFLDQDTGKCSIYRYRPWHCRTFHALDNPKYCWPPNQAHMLFGAPEDGYGSPLLLRLAASLCEMNVKAKLGMEVYLLTDYFPHVEPFQET